jgi:hypothetical protein
MKTAGIFKLLTSHFTNFKCIFHKILCSETQGSDLTLAHGQLARDCCSRVHTSKGLVTSGMREIKFIPVWSLAPKLFRLEVCDA